MPMKKVLRQLAMFTFVAFAVFSANAVAASGFDIDPGQSGTGFTSINTCNANCANIKNILSVDIPNPGDSQEFYVFADFRNASSGFISSPAAHLDFPRTGNTSQTQLKVALTGGGARTVRDGVTLTNLPDAWEIEFLPGSGSYVSIPVHPLRNDPQNRTCDTYYNKQFSYSGVQFTNPQSVSIPTDAHNSLPGLDYQYGRGWCQQGYVTYHMRVTNTSSQGGGGGGGTVDPQVDTLPATNVQQTSAYLNGKVLDGDNLEVWFVYATVSQALPSCSQSNQRVTVRGQYSAGQNFSKGVMGLSAGTTYYYRACASDGNTTDEGPIERFTTDQDRGWHWVADDWGVCSNGIQRRDVHCVDNNGNEDVSQVNCDATTKPETTRTCSTNDSLPEARTGDVTGIDTDSARLHGEVRMNDIDDGIVFFVYGESESRVDRADSYASYDAIPESGRRLQKVVVDDDNDTNDWQSYSERVTGLRAGEDYYYRICVDYYYQHAHSVTCGETRSFGTDEEGGGSTGEVEIRTLAPQAVGTTTAKLCGDLVDNGGDDSLLTWIEYRKAGNDTYRSITKKDRGEGEFCEIVRNLTPGTKYYYRACSENGCASSRYFTTETMLPQGEEPQVTTGVAYDIRAHSAKLPALYVSNANRAVVYFKYGHSRYLNKRTRSYTVYGSRGEVVHPFTNLRADQYYCYQAVIETVYGKDEGAVRCFYTPAATGGTVRPPKVVTVVKDDKPELDLEKLGLGLSFIQLDIDDNFDSVAKGQQVAYTVRWKNISKLNLRDLELNVEIPREVQILGASQGLIDRDKNSVYYTIDRLDAGEEGSMIVSGVVVDGNVGDALTANATLTFDNPVNGAKENATDYDVNTFVVPVAGVNIGAGSLFGLGNVTFLGWLTILLGLFILFLIARWLYLEREELRARAYANYHRGYYPPAPERHYEAPVRERYESSLRDVPSQRDIARGEDDPGYRPYRPNR